MAKARPEKVETTLQESILQKLAERKETLIVIVLFASVAAIVIAYEVYRRGAEPYYVSAALLEARGDADALEKLQEEYRDTKYEPRIAFEFVREILNAVDKPIPAAEGEEPPEVTDEEKFEAYSRACGILEDVRKRYRYNTFSNYFILADLLGTCERNRDFYNTKILDRDIEKAREIEDREIDKAIEAEKKAREETPVDGESLDGAGDGESAASDGSEGAGPGDTDKANAGNGGTGGESNDESDTE